MAQLLISVINFNKGSIATSNFIADNFICYQLAYEVAIESDKKAWKSQMFFLKIGV